MHTGPTNMRGLEELTAHVKMMMMMMMMMSEREV
jgi:hypothetical protein